jgi:putative Holliday junction resolvase
MKYLGIDYGTKRVGIATSDDEGRMAFPFRVIPNIRTLVEDVAAICTAERIDAIVMGESHNFQNQPNPLMKEILPFAEALNERTSLPVVFMPEVLSSREAMHLQGDNAQNDSSAAAIVLQSYLDKINPPRKESQDDDES